MARPKKRISITEDVVQMAYRYSVYPTDLQEYRMENWLGALCGLYNTGL